MHEVCDIKVKVLSQSGRCSCGHKVGDEWVLGATTPDKPLCLPALDAIFSTVKMMRYGGYFPGVKDPDVTEKGCPDIRNPVVFELRRIHKQV